jgi:CheY-like chemotaxis protein
VARCEPQERTARALRIGYHQKVASIPPSANSPLRVLYVDDSSIQLLQVRTALTEAGHHVAIATDLASARKLVGDRDLVILDWHMPEMNGGFALRALKQAPLAAPETLYYCYTVDVEVAAKYREHGFDGAFTAKGDMEVLIGQLDTARRMMRLRRYKRGAR